MKALFSSVVVLGLFASFASFASFAAGCGTSDDGGGGSVGSACTQSGGGGQCAAGAVCGKPSDGTVSLQCLVACTVQTDCPSGQDCNGVEGSSQKGCRPKSTTDGGVDAAKK